MCVQMLVGDIVGDVDPDHAGDVSKTVLQSLENLSADLVVLPKSNDFSSGIERLDVVRVDAAFFPKRGLPTHRPREQRRIEQMIVSGSDKKLRNLPFVQVFAYGKIARCSERAEHKQDVFLLDEKARQSQGGGRIGFIVIRDETYLAAIDPAALIEQVKICSFGFPYRAKDLQLPAVGHQIADTNFGI